MREVGLEKSSTSPKIMLTRLSKFKASPRNPVEAKEVAFEILWKITKVKRETRVAATTKIASERFLKLLL